MYPSGELTQLALRKIAVRQRIAVRRLEVVSLASEAARPVAWLDRAIVQWKKISPFAKFAALPLALLFRRSLLPKKVSLFRQVFRWAPAVFSALRMYRASRGAVR